jgi:hypothetical protein
MINHMRDLFLRIHMLPVAEQKEIMNLTTEGWMINSKQVDSMLIMGVKL